jgi:hypothetical protein
MSLKVVFNYRLFFWVYYVSNLTNYCLNTQVKLVKINIRILKYVKILFFVYNFIPNSMPMHKIEQFIMNYSLKTLKV